MIDIKITKTLNGEDFANIMITAFEGGIGYWCELAREQIIAAGVSHDMTDERCRQFRIDGVGPYANPKFWEGNHGYRLRNDDGEWAPTTLTKESVQAALDKMASMPEWHQLLTRLADEQYDADDADVVVQFAVWDELVYG